MKICTKIKQLRLDRGMTQEELGRALGVKKAAINKMELDQDLNLRADKIRLLSKTFMTFPNVFIYEDPDEFWSHSLGIGGTEPGALTVIEYLKSNYEDLSEKIGPERYKIIADLMVLNDKGMERVKPFIDDLVKIEEYRRGD